MTLDFKAINYFLSLTFLYKIMARALTSSSSASSPPSNAYTIHNSTSCDYFDMKASFYLSGRRPRSTPDTIYVKLPPEQDWFDHQAIIYKVRNYLISKTHDIHIYTNGRWSIFSKDNDEIYNLLQWCHATRDMGFLAADEILLNRLPYVFREPISNEIFGAVSLDQTLTLGLADIGDLRNQCSFLCRYTGKSNHIPYIKNNLANLPPLLSQDEYDSRMHYSRLGNLIPLSRLQNSFLRWHPGKRNEL